MHLFIRATRTRAVTRCWRAEPKGRVAGKRAAATSALLVAALCTGCSVHPVQQDVTGLRTTDLVDYIRCETRLAVQDKAIGKLAEEDGTNPLIGQLGAIRGKRWGAEVRNLLNARERIFYDRYIETGIAYDFSFDITVDNTGSGMADPVRLITNGTVGLGLSASGDFKRENLRHFIVSETFEDLLQSSRLDCSADYRSSNYAYPIAGSIGMFELISTFIDLNQLKSLTPDKSTSKVFADTLTFTTTITGSVSPHVIVAPAGNRWGLPSPASVSAVGSRLDKHNLIVGLSLDVSKGRLVRSAAAAAVVPGYIARSALQKGNAISPTEQSALDAVSQARLDAYLDRTSH